MEITCPFHVILYGGIGPGDARPRSIENDGIGIGKTTLAAKFVKEFGGIHCEIAPIIQGMGGKGKSPSYNIDHSKKGHASYACDRVGLNLEKQYRYARTWDELISIVDEATIIAMESPKRIWFIIDDTADWRTQAAFNASKVAGRSQITQSDWGQGTTDMQVMMQHLASNFNVIYINRNIDATRKVKLADGTSDSVITGSKQFYPNQADHRVEAVLRLEIIDNKRVIFIEKNTIMDILDLPKNYMIESPTPQKILEVLQFKKEFW